MSVLDILNQPWAITAEKLDAMFVVYERHLAGVKFEPEAIRAAIGGSSASKQADAAYTVQDGVAVIPVEGVLAKKMNIFTEISGGMSTQMLTAAVNDAVADPLVHSLLLDIDSPGGEVDGTQQIADAVAASSKPVAAWIDGLGCSAAYWIAAQCDSIYAASQTSTIGSIGVRMKHVDQSKANEARGLTVTHVASGKYKVSGNSDAPLSLDDRALMQDKLDYICTLFTNAVAAGRGVEPATVWADMGEGRTFFAQQALDAGLIDGIASRDEVVAQLAADYQAQFSNPGAVASTPRTRKAGANPMFRTFATEADFNAVLTAEFQRGVASTTASIESARTEGRAEGATAERTRIKAVQDQMLAGHGDLIRTLAFDGKTSGAEAAVSILAAEKTLRKDKADALVSDAPPVVPPSQAAVGADAAAIARRDANVAAAQANATADQDPHALAGKVTAHVAAQKKLGRNIGFAEAAAEVAKQK